VNQSAVGNGLPESNIPRIEATYAHSGHTNGWAYLYRSFRTNIGTTLNHRYLEALTVIQKYTILLVLSTKNLVFLESWLHRTTRAVSGTALRCEPPHNLAQNPRKHKNPLPEAHWQIGSISTATGTKQIAAIN